MLSVVLVALILVRIAMTCAPFLVRNPDRTTNARHVPRAREPARPQRSRAALRATVGAVLGGAFSGFTTLATRPAARGRAKQPSRLERGRALMSVRVPDRRALAIVLACRRRHDAGCLRFQGTVRSCRLQRTPAPAASAPAPAATPAGETAAAAPTDLVARGPRRVACSGRAVPGPRAVAAPDRVHQPAGSARRGQLAHRQRRPEGQGARRRSRADQASRRRSARSSSFPRPST